MTPDEFLSVAIRLSNSQLEGDLRSAVSRAYYGAFHTVRMFLEEVGVCFSDRNLYGADIHTKVQFCLTASGNADGVKASDKLRSLRIRRNEADYNFASKKFLRRADVIIMIGIAQDIVDAVERCRRGPGYTEDCHRIGCYARDVLRLTVRESQ